MRKLVELRLADNSSGRKEVLIEPVHAGAGTPLQNDLRELWSLLNLLLPAVGVLCGPRTQQTVAAVVVHNL